MEEIQVPKDVLPDSSQVVSEDRKPQPQEPVKEAEPAPEPREETPKEEPQKPPKGFVPLESLHEERNKRKELEARLQNLESAPAPTEYTDPDISSFAERLEKIEEARVMDNLVRDFPALSDKADEFAEFREGYPSTDLPKVAKLFLLENGLLGEEPPKRKGLEKPTGGTDSAPPTDKVSVEDIKRLRTEQPRKYEKMLREGKINPNDIK